MNVPSIEARLARTMHRTEGHPVARYLATLPGIGSLTRSWMRATRTESSQSLWASLPPVAAV